MFTVPKTSGTLQIVYALITNILLSAVLYTAVAIPYGSLMAVRTNSQEERGIMGTWRAGAGYVAGFIMAILIVPITNALGGTQSAWIKFGVIIGLFIILAFGIAYLTSRETATESGTVVEKVEEEEEAIPFREAITKLFHNKYWVIVLIVNLLACILFGTTAAAGTYYCKWIFGNDNLVGIIGAAGMLATVVGFILSKPIIAGLGIKRTISIGLLGAAILAGIRCFIPTNFTVCVVTGLLGSFVQIPMMSLYGVLTSMTIDYNEWKYDKKLVAMSGGAIGFGSKVGNGLGAAILSAFLAIGAYDATLEVASTSMIYSIYGFSNYLPVVINLVMFVIFLKFDLEEKLPKMREEIAARRAGKTIEK